MHLVCGSDNVGAQKSYGRHCFERHQEVMDGSVSGKVEEVMQEGSNECVVSVTVMVRKMGTEVEKPKEDEEMSDV